jgi:hypothetical protein
VQLSASPPRKRFVLNKDLVEVASDGLARRFALVHGYDILPVNLSYAAESAKEISLANVTFHVCSENFLAQLNECDVAYSRIVFQHKPPPAQCRLI